jgi:hypothetical protein
MLAWWTWEDGAFFGTVFYPGAALTFGILAVLLVGMRFGARIDGAARVALVALVALGFWTLASGLWSSNPAVALSDAAKAFAYAAMFAIGIWTGRLLWGRMILALTPVAAVGAFVAVGIVLTIATGHDVGAYVHLDDATLRFPLGYRNAEAAFLFISLWALLALAVESEVRWPLRAAMLAAITVLLELLVLAQSRGSILAAAVALVVYLTLSPRHLKAMAYLALALAPALIAVPTLLHVFQRGVGPELLPDLRDSARAIGWTFVLSLGLSAVFLGAVEPRIRIAPDTSKRLTRGLVATAVVVVACASIAVVAHYGGPSQFLSQKLGQFEQTQPTFSHQQTRFGLDVSSKRSDLWRVSLKGFEAHPLAGGGAGSFEYRYLVDRRTGLTPKDPHSVEMLMLGELGIVGFAMFATFLGGATVAVLRSRKLGPLAAGLGAGVLACTSYWLVHSSVDWLWRYPAVTAPVVFLLGAAAAPALAPADGASRRTKVPVLIAVAILIVGMTPLFLSERYAKRALGEWTGDVPAAYDDLDSAASLDPLDAGPLLTKGAIASQVGDRAVAIAAFRDAVDRVPDNYAGHYFLAQELYRTDPVEARRQIAIALAQNPHGPDVLQLAAQIDRYPRK